MNKKVQTALDAGFTYAIELDVTTLEPNAQVREMCAADKCGAYGKNWTCPPECGTLEECTARIRAYTSGILVQTEGELEDSFDFEGMQELNERHQENFKKAAEALREQYGEVLCLGSGGCRICKKCAHPEPCRFPEKACSSMEAYGLLVSQVCQANGIPYYYGKDTLTYTACYLFK